MVAAAVVAISYARGWWRNVAHAYCAALSPRCTARAPNLHSLCSSLTPACLPPCPPQWGEFRELNMLNLELNRRITTMEEQLWALRKEQAAAAEEERARSKRGWFK